MVERYNTVMKMLPKQTSPGFTLVEIIIVVALTVLLLTITVQSFLSSASQFAFANDNTKILELVNFARSLAISGKAQIDYIDYDKDGCKDAATTPGAPCVGDDFVTPAHYAVNFDKATNTATLFADMHQLIGSTPKEGQFDPCTGAVDYTTGCDIILDQYQLKASTFVLFPNAAPAFAGTTASIFYSPIFADISFDVAALPTDPFFTYELNQATGTVARKSCLQIHRVAGIPEPFSCP